MILHCNGLGSSKSAHYFYHGLGMGTPSGHHVMKTISCLEDIKVSEDAETDHGTTKG